jgi:hypothetical protein
VYDQKKSVAITPSSASIPAPIAPLPLAPRMAAVRGRSSSGNGTGVASAPNAGGWIGFVASFSHGRRESCALSLLMEVSPESRRCYGWEACSGGGGGRHLSISGNPGGDDEHERDPGWKRT